MAFHIVLVVKNPPANAGDAWDTGSIPGSGRSPGVGNGNFSSILTRKILWTEEPGGLQSRGSQRVEYNWVQPARIYCIACAKLLQSCLILCNCMNCSPPGFSGHEISHGGNIGVVVDRFFPRGSSWPGNWTHISCVSCIGRQILYQWATWVRAFYIY